MSTPFLGEVRLFGFSFPPKGWALCNGQLLPINQNQALFALLWTTYGGNGVQTFALPDLRSRTPIHSGNGFVQGAMGGEEYHTLTLGELPAHSHAIGANATSADKSTPQGNFWANSGRNLYASSPDSTMNSGVTGGSQPHENRPPYLVINFCIALQGIFPSRS
jgi:microcystin-dependent protein